MCMTIQRKIETDCKIEWNETKCEQTERKRRRKKRKCWYQIIRPFKQLYHQFILGLHLKCDVNTKRSMFIHFFVSSILWINIRFPFVTTHIGTRHMRSYAVICHWNWIRKKWRKQKNASKHTPFTRIVFCYSKQKSIQVSYIHLASPQLIQLKWILRKWE